MISGIEPYLLVESNLRHAMHFYARSTPQGELRQYPGVDIVSCGLNYPVFNSALLSTHVPGHDGDLPARLAIASSFFRALRHGWSYWLCHDMLDSHAQKCLLETCQSYSMEQVLTAPGMHATRLAPPTRKLPALDVRQVNDASSRLTFAHLVSTIFDLPFPMTLDIYGREAVWAGEYWGFIGYASDRPAAIAMMNLTNDCFGYYSVGTIPELRRRGLAEALMRRAYGMVSKETGLSSCVLQSSTAGRRLYEQMGFREVTRFSVFRSVGG